VASLAFANRFHAVFSLLPSSITAAMVYYLSRRKEELLHSNMIRYFVKVVLETGLCLAAISIALIILAATLPLTNFWMILSFPFGNIYVVSLLVTLNSRKLFKKNDLEATTGAQSHHSDPGETSSLNGGFKSTKSEMAMIKKRSVHLDLISVEQTPHFLKEDAYASIQKFTQPLSPTSDKQVLDRSRNASTTTRSEVKVTVDCSKTKSTDTEDKSKDKNVQVPGNNTKSSRRHKSRLTDAELAAEKNGAKTGSEVWGSRQQSTNDSSLEKIGKSSSSKSKNHLATGSFSSLMKRNHPPSRSVRLKAGQMTSSELVADNSSERMVSSVMSFHCRGMSLDCSGKDACQCEDANANKVESTTTTVDVSQSEFNSHDYTIHPTPAAWLGQDVIDDQQQSASFHECDNQLDVEEECTSNDDRVRRTSILSYDTLSSALPTLRSLLPFLASSEQVNKGGDEMMSSTSTSTGLPLY
jgi:hypothetical protein